MEKPDVLILASERDLTALAVADELRRRSAVPLIVDTEGFPLAWRYSTRLAAGWQGRIRLADRTIDYSLDSLHAAYVRRPGVFRFQANLTGSVHEFATVEARAGVLGTLMALPLKWVNHPLAEHRANYKPVQLAVAERLGLNPPDTVITNEPEDAREFIELHSGRTLYKSMGRYLSRKPSSLPLPATRSVNPAEIDESVALTAHMFQEVIPKAFDVRLTVVEDWQYAVAIHAPAGVLDWRLRRDDLRYEAVEVPKGIAMAVGGLMRHFGLAYGALDFAVATDGSWRFLEVNPSGQWLWLRDHVEMDVAERLADALLETR